MASGSAVQYRAQHGSQPSLVSELSGQRDTHNALAAILQRKVNAEDGGKEEQVSQQMGKLRPDKGKPRWVTQQVVPDHLPIPSLPPPPSWTQQSSPRKDISQNSMDREWV